MRYKIQYFIPNICKEDRISGCSTHDVPKLHYFYFRTVTQWYSVCWKLLVQ